MKIKDLPPNTNLGDLLVKTPSGITGYWVSQWAAGVWLKYKKEDTRIHPVFVDSLEECRDWEVLNFES